MFTYFISVITVLMHALKIHLCGTTLIILSFYTPSLFYCKFISMHKPSVSMLLLVSYKNYMCMLTRKAAKLNRTQ